MCSFPFSKLEPINCAWIQGARKNLIILFSWNCFFDCQAKKICEKYLKKQQGFSRYSFGLPEMSAWFGMNATPTQESPANTMPYMTAGLRPSLNVENLYNYVKLEVVGNKAKGWASTQRLQENKSRQISTKTNIFYLWYARVLTRG